MSARVRKDRMMAERMVAMSKAMPVGKRIAVAGNTLEHSHRLCALIAEVAKEQGADLSRHTFVPLNTEALTGGDGSEFARCVAWDATNGMRCIHDGCKHAAEAGTFCACHGGAH